MTTQIKICGLLTPAAVDAAILHGASHIGLNFFAKSPRYVTPQQAGALARHAGGRIKIVGLFVDASPAEIDQIRIHVRLDVIQLHGAERPALVAQIGQRGGLETWKAVPIRSAEDLKAAHKYRGAAHRILYDAKPGEGADLPGGNGLPFDWELLRGAAHPLPWALAGGLHLGNVAEALRISAAPMVDVSSGVESRPGVKDVDKIVRFCQAVREYDSA